MAASASVVRVKDFGGFSFLSFFLLFFEQADVGGWRGFGDCVFMGGGN